MNSLYQRESMNEINKEYSQFIQKKLSFIEFVKITTKNY